MALVQARATVTLVGLGPGEEAWVDEDDPQIARWLRGGQLRRSAPQPNPLAASTSDPEPAVEARASEAQPEVKAKPKRAPAKRVSK